MLKLRNLRNQKNKKLREVAKEIGITMQCLSNYETGRRTPTIEVLKKLAKYYECTIDDLL